MNAPTHPAGDYLPEPLPTPARRAELIAEIAALPKRVAELATLLRSDQWNAKFRNWTAKQIVHHLADSHVNAYVRFRLTLTEDSPTIKPYDESRWSELPDVAIAEPRVSIEILTAIHARWVMLMAAMTEAQWSRTYVHPEYKKTFALEEALGLYAHHGRHHSAQLAWIAANR